MATIDFELTCAACNADLRGADLFANCPHCDAPVAGSIDLEAIDATSRTVTADARCVSCGYNLRTLALDACCPECAASVAASLRPDSLHFADAKWLDNLATGLNILPVALIGIPCAALVAQLTRYVAAGELAEVVAMFAALAVLPLVLFSCVAIYHLTAADPALTTDAIAPSNRHLSQGFAILICPAALLVFGGVRSASASPRLVQIAVGTAVVVLITAPLAIAGTLRCLREIARRARRPRMVRLCTTLVWLTIVAGALIAAGSILSLLRPYLPFLPATPWPPRAVASPVRTIIALLLGGGVVVLFAGWLYGLIVLFRFRRLVAGIRATHTHMTAPMEINVERIEGMD